MYLQRENRYGPDLLALKGRKEISQGRGERAKRATPGAPVAICPRTPRTPQGQWHSLKPQM
jgi:hypothetical protein